MFVAATRFPTTGCVSVFCLNVPANRQMPPDRSPEHGEITPDPPPPSNYPSDPFFSFFSFPPLPTHTHTSEELSSTTHQRIFLRFSVSRIFFFLSRFLFGKKRTRESRKSSSLGFSPPVKGITAARSSRDLIGKGVDAARTGA